MANLISHEPRAGEGVEEHLHPCSDLHRPPGQSPHTRGVSPHLPLGGSAQGQRERRGASNLPRSCLLSASSYLDVGDCFPREQRSSTSSTRRSSQTAGGQVPSPASPTYCPSPSLVTTAQSWLSAAAPAWGVTVSLVSSVPIQVVDCMGTLALTCLFSLPDVLAVSLGPSLVLASGCGGGQDPISRRHMPPQTTVLH